jgi:hypothetical protein
MEKNMAAPWRQFYFYYPAGMALFFACLAVGCGYHFRATGEPVGIQLESLAIPLVPSTSSTLGFEAVFTRVIREEFISHGNVPLLAADKAQAVLKGTVTDIRTDPVSFESQESIVSGTVTTYSVTASRLLRVRLEMQLLERKSGKVVWREQDMEERATFAVDDDPLVTRFNQRQALEKIAVRFARRIYLKTMERF